MFNAAGTVFNSFLISPNSSFHGVCNKERAGQEQAEPIISAACNGSEALEIELITAIPAALWRKQD
jgi:hypothetical protein